jgi:hypothetical protein
MLIQRIHQPEPDEILYHYCNIHSLKSILETGRLRFSDINMLNDSAEARWGYKVFTAAATELLYKRKMPPEFASMNKEFFDKIDEILAPIQLRMHPFIACMSKVADQLSQWRAYADDGKGFAIGFRAEALKFMPISLLGVEYDPQRQIEEMIEALGATYMENKEHGEDFGKAFFLSCAMIGSYKVAYKNPAFQEEREVRCLHVINTIRDEHSMKFVDGEGMLRGQKESSPEEIGFHVSDAALIAHVDLPFRKEFAIEPIAEIVLGPKCPNGPGNILFMLGKEGYKDVRIRVSAATYR